VKPPAALWRRRLSATGRCWHAKNWDTRAGAESGAVQSCQQGGHPGCQAIYSYRNRLRALAGEGRADDPAGLVFVAGAQVGSAAKADALSACAKAGSRMFCQGFQLQRRPGDFFCHRVVHKYAKLPNMRPAQDSILFSNTEQPGAEGRVARFAQFLAGCSASILAATLGRRWLVVSSPRVENGALRAA